MKTYKVCVPFKYWVPAVNLTEVINDLKYRYSHKKTTVVYGKETEQLTDGCCRIFVYLNSLREFKVVVNLYYVC